MKRIMIALLLLWSLIATQSDALAQSPELMSAYRQSNTLKAQGKYAEAELFAKKALDLGKKEFGPNHQSYATLLNNLAALYQAQIRYGEAEPLFKRSLAIKEKARGPDHPSVAGTLNALGGLYYKQGRYSESAALFKRSLAIDKKTLGPDHPDLATSLNNLALLYEKLGRYGEAEPLYKRSLAIYEKARGPDHSSVAGTLNNLAVLYKKQGRYGEATLLYKRSLAINEKTFGPNHSRTARLLNNLAVLYGVQGRYGEAALLQERALAIREKRLGPNHPLVATSLDNLALLYIDQGRYADAGPLSKRALAIKEKTLGPNHPDVATSLVNLAGLYVTQGRYDEAEPLYKRSLANYEKTLGPEHPLVAGSLVNLAEQYRAQGRYREAEPLYKRSLAIYEKALGPDHALVATSLNTLAVLYTFQRRFREAEQLSKRSLAINEKAFGPFHPSVAVSLGNLAEQYRAQGRYDEAAPLSKRSLAILEKALGPDHTSVATSLNNLAGLYDNQGNHGKAALLLKRSLTIYEKALGPNHPEIASSLSNLAAQYRAQGKTALSLNNVRRAVTILRNRAIRTGGGDRTSGLSEQKSRRFVFLFHLLDTLAMSKIDPENRVSLDAEGFESGQFANATRAGTAVARMAARFAAGDDALAGLVRERQDAAARWRRLDKALVKAVGQPPGKRDKTGEAATRRELNAVDATMNKIDAELASSFPQFAELSAPKPVSLAETQALLAEDEALLTYLVWDDTTFVFAVRRDRVLVKQITLGAEELEEAVTDLRAGLDPTNVQSLADIPPFSTTRAFALYQKIFQPVERMLAGARHVFVVPDGALQSLPLGVLVTKESTSQLTGFSRFRETAWLARKYAMTTLPLVSSLRALRLFARRSKATRPFLGIGDPKLDGETGSNRGVKLATLFTPRGVADVAAVRQLASLPDSFAELQSLARVLGAGDEALLVGTEATETRIKQMALHEYKVLAFATHGLVAGDFAGLSEPALVLTPPETGSKRDDGLLTASEVAQLKLDADWVILSACNTAAADGTPGAEGLSGLAKAFFYAGSRALLVSHWPVFSNAAVAITTRMLKEAAKPGVGRAEAHRRAMLALIDDTDNPHYAHPLFWAPFVVVGEGGTYAVK